MFVDALIIWVLGGPRHGQVGDDSGFAAKETARVKKLIDGKVSESKKAMLELRLNLLASFTTPAKDEL